MFDSGYWPRTYFSDNYWPDFVPAAIIVLDIPGIEGRLPDRKQQGRIPDRKQQGRLEKR